MDACLMAMVEIAYQVKNSTEYLVGSQQTEPNEGWPYDRVLKVLATNPALSPGQLSEAIVTQYLASYGINAGVTMAAINLAEIETLSSAIDDMGKALSTALRDSAARTAIVTARAQVQEYEPPYDQYCDLADLCDLLEKHVGRADVKAACKSVSAAVRNSVIKIRCEGRRSLPLQWAVNLLP